MWIKVSLLEIQCINCFGDEDKIIQYNTECGRQQHYEAQDLSAKICNAEEKAPRMSVYTSSVTTAAAAAIVSHPSHSQPQYGRELIGLAP